MAQLVKSIFSGLASWGSARNSAGEEAVEQTKVDAQEAKGGEAEQKHPQATRPVEHRDYDLSELQQFDGSVPDVAILIAVRGKIFDVSSRADLYGIGGAYSWMAGKEASRMLAKMTKDVTGQDCLDLSDLTEKETKVLEEWEKFFAKKYDVVGSVIQPATTQNEEDGEEGEDEEEDGEDGDEDGEEQEEEEQEEKTPARAGTSHPSSRV